MTTLRAYKSYFILFNYYFDFNEPDNWKLEGLLYILLNCYSVKLIIKEQTFFKVTESIFTKMILSYQDNIRIRTF